MARKTRNSTLETRSARVRLGAGKRHWQSIRQGLAVGYRKRRSGDGGSWEVRYLKDGRYVMRALGAADDHQEADGVEVLSYDHAQERARDYASEATKRKDESPRTVADAVAEYLEWYELNRRGVSQVRAMVSYSILPALGSRRVDNLTHKDIEKWHNAIARSPARYRNGKPRPASPEDQRKRKHTANRTLTTLKAALNRQCGDGPWQRVKPFRGVDSPIVRYLTPDECRRLVNACDPDFRDLVLGALHTGARYGELKSLEVRDFDASAGTVHLRNTKAGKPRHSYLTDDGVRFFTRLVAGRAGSEAMFVRANGEPWGRSHQHRPLQKACDQASIDPRASFHILRHTYGSALARAGVPLQVIAHALGHADTRITERHYAHLMPSYVAATIRANLPSFGEGTEDNVVSLKHRG